MKSKHAVLAGVVALSVVSITPMTAAGQDDPKHTATLVDIVRRATARFRDVAAATAAGYAPLLGCVSAGADEGAMGLHLVNGNLVGDGLLDPERPEALVYEARNGRLQLLGVEFIVDAATWNKNNQAPPTLVGQLFNYVGSPNRYGLPAFYELHVWAWKHNPHGDFVDFNPNVSCRHFTGVRTP
jgi:hypothetical protein